MRKVGIALLVVVTLSVCLSSLAEAREPIYQRVGDRVNVENDTDYRLPMLRRFLFQIATFQGPW